MIKSQIVNKQNGKNWGLVFLGIVAAVLMRSLILGEEFTSPLELFVFYPTIIVTAFLVARLVTKHMLQGAQCLNFLLALGLGFLVSLLPVWGNVAAAMPLSLAQIGTYLLTLGVYPMAVGPDGLLRGIAWSLAIIVAVASYRDKKELFKTIAIAVAVWFLMTVVFLLPSIVLIVTMAVNSLPMTQSGTGMVSEFTRLNLYSYWADGQLLRWFTGFGGQATNALLLFSASWVFVLGVIVWAILKLDLIKQSFKGFRWDWLVLAFTIVVFSYVAGTSLQAWNGLDMTAWLVLVLIIFLGWMLYRSLELYANVESLLLLMWLLGLSLLGWMVLVPGLALLLLGYIKVEFRQAEGMIRFGWILDAFALGSVMLMIVLFMRRGLALEDVMLQIVGMGTIFALLAEFIGYAKKVEWNRLTIAFGWLIAGVLLWAVSGVFTGAAVMMLAGVFMWLFWQKVKDYSWEPSLLVWGMALVVLLLVIYLPRMAHPELIPR